MTEQQFALFPPPSRKKVTAESIAALRTIEPQLPNLRQVVLDAVLAAGLAGATVKEVVDATGLQRLTVGARLTELKQAGTIEDGPTVREHCRALVAVSLCPGCREAKRRAYSDATTPGFFHDKCSKHWKAQQ